MWRSIFFFSALACFSQVDGLKVLGLFPHPGGSHQRMFDRVMLELLDRGHSVTAVSHYALKGAVGDYRHVDFNSTSTHTGALSFDQYDFKLFGFESVYDAISIYIEYVVRHGVASCEQILSSPTIKDLYFSDEKFDVVLTESFNSDFMYVFAEKMNIPMIAMETHQIAPWVTDRLGQPENPSYIPNFLSSFSDDISLLGRLENFLIHLFHKYSYRYLIQREEEKIIKEKLGIEVDLEEIAKKRTALLLSNTYHVLNRPRPLVPSIKEAGGMHMKTKLGTLDKDVEKFINESKHGVVVFSFGSLLNTSTIAPQKLKAFIQVLSELPQRVIWKYNDVYMPNKPKNVKLVTWLQQQEILAHPNVRGFISHGGLLGMTEAINYGVPTIVLSVLGDQHLNGAAAQVSGLGATMMYRHVTEENMREALRKILSPEMQASAKRLSKQWKDRPLSPIDTALFWIEFVGRNPTAQLSTKARDLPFHSYMLLDVILVIALILMAIAFTIYMTLKMILGTILGAVLGAVLGTRNSKLPNKKHKRQ